MYFKLADKIGIKLENGYVDRFGTHSMEILAKKSNEEEFKKSAATLSIEYESKLDFACCMSDGHCFYNDHRFVDTKLGVQIEKLSDTEFVLKANQDCPEWFICMLEITMLSAGLTFAHCAALEKNGRALFLPARGGVGKTATVVKMVQEHGWRLLGDDLVILDKESRSVYAFPKQFVIYGYHKSLFPQFFEGGKGPVRSEILNHTMTKMIPVTKKILRKVPSVLAFAREHNPQQIRVYPKDIFAPEQLSEKADCIRKSVWLERTEAESVNYRPCDPIDIASRCAAVTLDEVTYGSMNLNNCLFTMCGSGLLSFARIYNEIYEIVLQCVEDTEPHVLGIPKKLAIDKVSDVVFESVGE